MVATRSVKALAVLSAVVTLVATMSGIAVQSANAADATQFDPGNIISDQIFYNSSLMNESQIQSFLDSKVRTCSTAAQAPCLKSYRQSSAPRAADKYCTGAYQGGTDELASRIIMNVASACNINPQVLLVTLQKEQGLVTSTSPTPGKYKIAMGYGCPDTAACDSKYYGFANQLYSAARQFQIYAMWPNDFRYRPGQDNVIQWHPNAQCGSSHVLIQNTATAGLYIYTPYRPNQAALSNLYGLGDGCSSYGNRNFWVYFTDWFGSTTISQAAQSFVKAVYQDVLARQPSEGEAIVWGKALMAYMPRSQVAGAFVNSDEFRLQKIDLAYKEVLGRAADDAGRIGWLNGMRAGTLSPDDVYRIFMQSEEYFNSTGGTNPKFVAAVYERILKRPAAQPEIDYWTSAVDQYGRAGVVDLIWFSVETARARVAVMYQDYLARTPDWAGLVQWGDYALRYGDSAVRSAILGSDEYESRAISRYP
ncbi:hypothetical protein GCM10027052_02440 [Parafrigoribacterium mesophilum]|uniref:DUF4214 domain-containing protein n=1 Tax=Parafrigoribacterium mesophilum TaxID=433646 RepID=UPI0031FDF384